MASLADRLRGRRVGVALASGFFGFYHHAGTLRALVERGIHPDRMTGNSAGALVGAMYCAGLDPAEVGEELLAVKRADFWDMHWPISGSGFGLLAGHALAARLSRVLPVHGFEQCRVPIAVGVYDIETGRIRHLDAGSLIRATCASCAVPYLFSPVIIDGRQYWDGGFGEKTPLVPFLEGPEVDVVVISHMPHRDKRRKDRLLPSVIPPLASLFAGVPRDEIVERDATGIAALEERGIEVVTLSLERVWLGPFSMGRAKEAMEVGYRGCAALLDAEENHAQK